MDNTELHYVTFDPDEIWNEMIAKYVEAGGDILYPGDEKEMLLRSVQADIVQVFAGVDNALRMATLRYAVGPYLDEIGDLRGCTRIKASTANATVTIITKTTGESGILPAGTAMTHDGQLYYTLVEDFILTGTQKTETVDVVCDRQGSIGNTLVSGMQMSFVQAKDNEQVISIVAASDATGGNEEEDDESYRERIREYGLATVSTGPQRQYESAAKAVSSQIVDARALNLDGGSVGIYLILSSQSGAAALLESVEKALSATDVRPLTDLVSVYQAIDITYILNVQVESDGSAATTTAINNAVETYQSWQDNTIGRAFNPDRLMAALYQAGCTRVSWYTGSVFDEDGDIEYTEIGDNERCKGTITLIPAES